MKTIEKKSLIKWIALTLGAGGLLAGLLFLFRDQVDWDSVKDWVGDTHGLVVFILMAILPVFGFSVGLVYWFAGFRFGPWMGLLVVGGAIAVHLALTFWISNGFLKNRVHRFFAKRQFKLPEVPAEDHVSVTVLAALIPGLPYAVRNYLLAMTEVPFRLYFWICWPIYLLRSWIAIFIGDFSMDLEWNKLIWIGGILVLKIAICVYLIRRVRAHLRPSPST